MLKIEKVIVENFCQHEHTEVNLQSGLIGIFGRNGLGKSNLANAICFAFTGDTRRHSKGAAGCVRQNQPGSARVEVIGEVGDKNFRILREIAPKGTIKHSLWVGDDTHKTFTKAKEIEAWLEEMSGISPQLMSEFLFIGQQDFYSFLEATNSDLSKKFTTLCKTQGYSHKREFYSDCLKRDIERTRATATVSRDFLESAIKDAKENLRINKQALAQSKRDVKAISPKTPEAIRANIQKARSRLDKLKQLEKDIADYTKERQKVWDENAQQTNRFGLLREQFSQEQKTLFACEENLSACQGAFSAYLDGKDYEVVKKTLRDQSWALLVYNKYVESLEKLQKQLKDLPRIPKPDPEVKKAAEAWLKLAQEEYAEKDSQRKSLLKLVQVMDQLDCEDKSGCPLCGAASKHWGVDIAGLKKDILEKEECLQKHSETMRDLKRELEDWKQNELEHTQAKGRYQNLKKQIAETQDLVDAHAKKKPESDPNAKLDELENLHTFAEQAEKEYQIQFQKTEATAAAQLHVSELIEKNRVRLASMDHKFHAVNVNDPERVAERVTLEKSIEDMAALERQVSEGWSAVKTLEGSVATSEAQLAELSGRLEQLDESEAASERTEEWFKKCEVAVNWFKKDGIPRLIHRSFLAQLVSVINFELSFFSSPFTVEVNEDLTFTATFPNGTRTASKDLSGGEKVMLALSFWSSVNRTFAQNLGIMVLDEPTDGLDTENKQRLYLILEEWGKVLRQRGQQVIIITHDSDMEEVFDQVVVLEGKIYEHI